jgi:hypothetical protein
MNFHFPYSSAGTVNWNPELAMNAFDSVTMI